MSVERAGVHMYCNLKLRPIMLSYRHAPGYLEGNLDTIRYLRSSHVLRAMFNIQSMINGFQSHA